MLLRHLTLENFRNIARLDLELPPGRTVLYGDNAQGKTNLLEAVSMFAAAKSVRADHDRDLLSWAVHGDTIPYTRVAGTIARSKDEVRVEIVLQLGSREEAEAAPGPPSGRQLLKRTKVNGVPRRAGDFVGEVQAVLFEPQDIELVYGPPSLRRRHLDLTLSQVDRPLLRELQRYNRVLAQRNSLIKSVRDGAASPGELTFWDGELIEAGSFIVEARALAISEVSETARSIHSDLTAGRETLRLVYRPSLDVAAGAGRDSVKETFAETLESLREREIAAGTTLAGPHRDDLAFEIDGVGLAAFGSRGQHRLATLSLKLAEARFMTSRTGEEPLLLLDDVLSELDEFRRGFLLESISQYGQSILTTADLPSLDRDFRSQANLLRIVDGRVEPPDCAGYDRPV